MKQVLIVSFLPVLCIAAVSMVLSAHAWFSSKLSEFEIKQKINQ